MRIQYVGKSDQVADLDRKAFPEDLAVEVEKSNWWLVYDDTGVPAGFGGLGGPHDRYGGHVSTEITRVGLLPHVRGKGLQRRVVRVLMAAAKKRGATRITATIHHGNIASMRNFVRCGFKPYYQREGFVWWERFL